MIVFTIDRQSAAFLAIVAKIESGGAVGQRAILRVVVEQGHQFVQTVASELCVAGEHFKRVREVLRNAASTHADEGHASEMLGEGSHTARGTG